MSGIHQGKVLYFDNQLWVIDCEICGWAHLDPRPSLEAVERFYREEYHTDGHFERVQRDEEWYHARAIRLLSPLNMPRSLLDVGCGNGFLLDVAKFNGAKQLLGVEPSLTGAELATAKHDGIWRGEFDDQAEAAVRLRMPQGIEAATLINVLEHLLEPEITLRRIARLLQPGGKLLIVVPRDFSDLQKRVCDKHGIKPWWVHKTHLNYWTPSSLTQLLWKTGFEVIRETTSFPLEAFALTGPCYVGNPELGRQAHEHRMALELAVDALGKDLLPDLYHNLAHRGQGREIILYARKI